MVVYLYKNKSAPNVVNKSITNRHETSATFNRHENYDILNPILVLKESGVSFIVKYNYVYIPDNKRYYYIDSVTSEGGLFILHCRCDVLMSHKTDILNSKQYIIRQQSNNNSPYLEDSMLPITSQHNYISKQFGDPVIIKSCNRVILATTGLGGTPVPSANNP